MIAIRKLSLSHPDFQLVWELLLKVFPPRERIDLPALFQRFNATLLGIYTGKKTSQFTGFLIVIEDELMVYLLYFVTSSSKGTTDIGTQALHALLERYSGRPVMMTYAIDSQPNDNSATQSESRCAFYLRNGFYECPWSVLYRDSEYGLASSDESVENSVIERLLHLCRVLGVNFYTHSG